MTITDQYKQKAKDFAAQLQSMAVWLTSLASSTEPGEVECVCAGGLAARCRKKLKGTDYICTRAEGHEGPCVACGGKREHDITGALKREPESIDLVENNPEKRPEWWRELGHLEVIEAGDVFNHYDHGWKPTGCAGEKHETRSMKGPDSESRFHLPHYRLRPWREVDGGEVLCDGNEFFDPTAKRWVKTIGKGTPHPRHRTRRPKPVEPPKEPELRLPDGTDISEWPLIEEGELMYKGDARFFSDDKWRLWRGDPIKVTAHEFESGNQFRRRVLPCRHCGGEAAPHGPMWYCPRCDQAGPSDDPNAVKWNEQNRTSVERSEKEEA